MRIDHVIIGTRRLEQVRELLWSRYGFGITDGTPGDDGTEAAAGGNGVLQPFASIDVAACLTAKTMRLINQCL